MTQENLQINSAAITDKGLSEKRPENEDSYLELRDSGFFAVADGVGGAQAGDVASQMAMEILGEAFINLREGGDAEERMKLAIEQANTAIYQMSRDLPQLSTMATTVVGLHMAGNIATIGHVGDSRLYRVDARGTLFRETHDHSVVEEEVRAGRLTPEQAETHPSRNVISRALGAEDIVEIDMKTIMFEPGTTFLICSDGVTRHISDEELQQLLFSEEDTFALCSSIKKICYERGAEDNLTAVVVKVTETDSSDGAFDEEETIATARTTGEMSGFGADGGIDEETLEMPPPGDLAPEASTAEFEDSNPILIPASGGNNTVSDEEGRLIRQNAEENAKTYRVDEEAAGALGKFLTYLPWLLLAGIIALGAYYYWSTQQGTNDLQSQTDDITLTTFEKARRTVDENPAQYVAVAGNIAKDAADHYLLGRAYFLQGRYDSSKRELDRAKDMLAKEAASSNRKVIENEIPMMLAIIESDEAKAAFEREVSGDEATSPEPESNTAN